LDLAAASAYDETKRPWVGNRRIMEMEEGKKGRSCAAGMKGHLRKQKRYHDHHGNVNHFLPSICDERLEIFIYVICILSS